MTVVRTNECVIKERKKGKTRKERHDTESEEDMSTRTTTMDEERRGEKRREGKKKEGKEREREGEEREKRETGLHSEKRPRRARRGVRKRSESEQVASRQQSGPASQPAKGTRLTYTRRREGWDLGGWGACGLLGRRGVDRQKEKGEREKTEKVDRSFEREALTGQTTPLEVLHRPQMHHDVLRGCATERGEGTQAEAQEYSGIPVL
jgi:hypothetical protein